MLWRSRLVAGLDTPRRIAFAAILSAFGLWLVLRLISAGAWLVVEDRSSDWIWRLGASDQVERRVILVDIDEPSLNAHGNWPWPRTRLAELSDRLAAEGVALQVFDIVLPAPAVGDEQLLSSFRRNQVVLSQVFALDDRTHAESGVPSFPLEWAACPPSIAIARGHIANAGVFRDIPAGHITPKVGDDGVIRLQPSLICAGGKAYPALFIAALLQAHGQGAGGLGFERGSGALGAHWQLTGVPLVSGGVPLDPAGNVRIPWIKKTQGWVSLSAADVLAGRIPQGLLQNAWVVVGSTALGLNDRIATPFGGSGAGLTVHAQLLQGALDSSIPAAPRLAGFFETVAVLLGCALLVNLMRLRPSLTLLAGTVASLSVVLVLAKSYLLIAHALWFEWVPGVVFLILFALCQGLYTYARSRFERDRLYNHLSSYLPGPVAAALARQDPSDAIDADRRSVAVLYADIRNFSGYCETRPPEESTRVLHAFFSTATCVIEEHGGIVESLQGDAVLAVWGGGPHALDCERAVQAARLMIKASHQILPAATPEDLAPLELGIGLEAGVAIVGSFGLARRRAHLALGYPVTTATRLQEMTAELAHPILIGEGMAASLTNHPLTSQGIFLLDGLKVPCHIYAYPLRDSVEPQ